MHHIQSELVKYIESHQKVNSLLKKVKPESKKGMQVLSDSPSQLDIKLC